MHFTKRIINVLVLVTAVAFTAGSAAAQSHRSAFTLNGGGSVHGDLGPFPTTPAQFEPGWITGLQLERWLGSGRLGLRLGTLWTQREIDQAGPSMYNVFAAGADLLFRIRPSEAGNAFAPFLGLGAGAIHYAGVASTGTLLDGAYGDPVYRAYVTPSLGADFFASGRSGLRLEVGDQIVLPSIGRSPPSSGLPMVHNMVVTLGFQVRTGSLGSAPRVTTAEPATAEPAQGGPGGRTDELSRSELEARLAEKERQVARLQTRIDSLERRLAGADSPRPRPSGEPAPAPAPTTEAGDADARFTVQVGSFVEAATADRWVQRLRERGFPVWRSDTEIEGERVSRVRVGALATESEAHTLADLLKRDYGWPVWVDGVRDDEAVPADAVRRTRAVLYR
ncbi:MAG: SPOR domain-containing protein [Longimicrobiales bacterium]